MNDRDNAGEKIAYCFYMTPKGIVFFPRKHQGDERYRDLVGDVTDPKTITTGFAFYEMLGEILIPYKLNFQDSDEREGIEKRIRDIFDALTYEINV